MRAPLAGLASGRRGRVRRAGAATAFAVLALVAAAAGAGVGTQLEGAARIYCSDADGSPHPRRIDFERPLGDAEVQAFQGGRLVMGYDRDGDDTGTGSVKATARLRRADGSSKKLGKIAVKLNRVTGETVGVRPLRVDPQPGDTLEWTFRFKKAKALDAGHCFTLIASASRPTEGCGPYGRAGSSPYILPFSAGLSSVMSQGNCSPVGSHRFNARHAYDFALPIGTEILAVAAGVVEFVEDFSADGTGLPDDDNVIQVLQDDGTYVNYVHLQQDSALVAAGDRVDQGQVIALSGNSGSTGGVPHLHLQLMSCPARSVCGTLPITFNNTSAHPDGLQAGKLYRAR